MKKNKIEEAVNLIKEFNLSFKALYYLYQVYYLQIKDLNDKYNGLFLYNILLELERENYILVVDLDSYNYTLTSKVKEMFDKHNYTEKKEFEISDEFIAKYRQLFKDTGRIGIMGDKIGVKKKFKAFSNDYPEYFKEELILKAAKKYIDSEAMNSYRYLQQADYFIYKNHTSRLAQYCEEISNGLGTDSSTNVLDL